MHACGTVDGIPHDTHITVRTARLRKASATTAARGCCVCQGQSLAARAAAQAAPRYHLAAAVQVHRGHGPGRPWRSCHVARERAHARAPSRGGQADRLAAASRGSAVVVRRPCQQATAAALQRWRGMHTEPGSPASTCAPRPRRRAHLRHPACAWLSGRQPHAASTLCALNPHRFMLPNLPALLQPHM
jgi:hypothetical protein